MRSSAPTFCSSRSLQSQPKNVRNQGSCAGPCDRNFLWLWLKHRARVSLPYAHSQHFNGINHFQIRHETLETVTTKQKDLQNENDENDP